MTMGGLGLCVECTKKNSCLWHVNSQYELAETLLCSQLSHYVEVKLGRMYISVCKGIFIVKDAYEYTRISLWRYPTKGRREILTISRGFYLYKSIRAKLISCMRFTYETLVVFKFTRHCPPRVERPLGTVCPPLFSECTSKLFYSSRCSLKFKWLLLLSNLTN